MSGAYKLRCKEISIELVRTPFLVIQVSDDGPQCKQRSKREMVRYWTHFGDGTNWLDNGVKEIEESMRNDDQMGMGQRREWGVREGRLFWMFYI